MIWSRTLAYITGTVVLRRNLVLYALRCNKVWNVMAAVEKCARAKLLSGRVNPGPDVGKNVAAKASSFNKSQQLSANGPQEVQYQSLKNLKFQQSSMSFGIWFGTRWST